MDIKFVSYTGHYPNLCSGVLTLLINSKEYIFGHDYSKGNYDKDGHYEKFWQSGGSCGFRNNYTESYVNDSEWMLDDSELPDELKIYSKELINCFNENVTHGCCGGCL